MQNQESFSFEAMSHVADKCGWKEEALLIKNHEGSISDPILVLLSRVNRCFNPDKSAIVIGDTTALASFLKRRGDFLPFEQSMRKAIDNLIEHSTNPSPNACKKNYFIIDS